MGREAHKQSGDVEFESYHPGCMGGIFNVLDYHHWYNVKKIFPHRKLNRERHARCCANPQTISMEREPVESQRLLDVEAEQIQVQQQTRKTGTTNKKSGEEKAKEDNHNKPWIIGHSSARSQSRQIDATHHLEPSSFGLGWMNPIILVRKRGDTSDTSSTKSKKPDIRDRKNADKHFEHTENPKKHANDKRGTRTLINQKSVSKKLTKQVSYNQVEGVDVLEIFKVNKDLFIDILQDPEVGISKNFPGKQTSKAVKLTKSGSFPMPDSPRSGYLRSSTLEHKQKEVWSFGKGEKYFAGTRFSKSKALTRSDDRFRRIVKEEASSSSHGSDSQMWNNLVMNRLKDIKQRIKQALKERRNRINLTRANELALQVSSRDASTTNDRDVLESSEKTIDSYLQTNADDHDICNDRLKRMRRTKSINESLNKYTQLFQHRGSEEANLHHSKSLKLSNEDKVPSKGNAPPKFFRRISSLSDLESFCSLLYEVSAYALSSEIPIRNIQDYDADKGIDAHNELKPITLPEETNKFEVVEAVIEAELQEHTREGSNNRDSTSLSVDKKGEHIAKPCEFNEDAVELTQSISDLNDISSTTKLAMSEGLSHPNSPEGEAELFTKGRHKTSQDSVDYNIMGNNSSRILFFGPDTEADPWYNYVKYILKLAGFTQNEGLETWFSPDHPLDPSMFKETETILHPELESIIHEIGSNCNHQLVFDLVDEALLEMGEKSSAYFPKPFSFSSGISLMLKRNSVVQEVWTKVSKNLDSQPEHDQSLDDIVARDLEKHAWMNLEAKSEFVALELEDLVLDELLDEVLCCLDE